MYDLTAVAVHLKSYITVLKPQATGWYYDHSVDMFLLPTVCGGKVTYNVFNIIIIITIYLCLILWFYK